MQEFTKDTNIGRNAIYATRMSDREPFMDHYHFHEHCEINISLTGNNIFYINDAIYNASEGDIFVIPKNILHKTTFPRSTTYNRIVIMFDPVVFYSQNNLNINPNLLFDEISRTQHISAKQLDIDKILLISNQLISAFEKESIYQDILGRSFLSLLIIELHRQLNQKRSAPSKQVQMKTKMATIIDYIHRHIKEKLEINELATLFNISPYSLNYYFQSNYGKTVKQYILDQKIIHAKKLLLAGHNVNETSEAIGFKDSSHFIRLFKKKIGQTPKQYAKGSL